jgi:hypothetical protein
VLLNDIAHPPHHLSSFFPTNTDEKIFNLCQHPVASQLRAVKNRSYISVPFSGSTLGVKIGATALHLAEAMAALIRDGHELPSVQFTSIVAITADGQDGSSGTQAVAKSGVKVYTTLPSLNGVDLENTCVVDAPTVIISDDVGVIEEPEEEDTEQVNEPDNEEEVTEPIQEPDNEEEDTEQVEEPDNEPASVGDSNDSGGVVTSLPSCYTLFIVSTGFLLAMMTTV